MENTPPRRRRRQRRQQGLPSTDRGHTVLPGSWRARRRRGGGGGQRVQRSPARRPPGVVDRTVCALHRREDISTYRAARALPILPVARRPHPAAPRAYSSSAVRLHRQSQRLFRFIPFSFSPHTHIHARARTDGSRARTDAPHKHTH